MGAWIGRARSGTYGAPGRAPLKWSLGALCLIAVATTVLAGCSVSSLTGSDVGERSVDELVTAVREGDDAAAQEATAELARRKDAAATAGLAAVVRDQGGTPRAKVALTAIDALGPAASAALIKELEYEQPDRARRALKGVLAGWARHDKATVRLLIKGLGKQYQHWWADDVLVKAGDRAAGQVATAMRSVEPKVAMRCACVLAREKDERAVSTIVDGLIADRGYDGSTWDAAQALDTPVVAKLVAMSRGGEHSKRAAYVLVYWVLGIPSQLSKADKDKARQAAIDALYRTGDLDLGFAMWDEGDAVLTKGAQDWAHSRGRYFHREGD